MAAPRVTIPELPEQTTPVDTDQIVVQNGPTTKRMTIGRLTTQNTTALTDHVNETIGAHAASAVSAAPSTAPMTGTDVQAQLGQAASAIAGAQTAGANAQAAVDAHIADVTDAHAAASILFTPAGTVTATTVQAAVEQAASFAGVPGPEGPAGPPGPTGPAGTQGAPGTGVPPGGSVKQVLTKLLATDYAVGWETALSSTTVTTIWTGTQAAYDAIGTKDAATLYFIT